MGARPLILAAALLGCGCNEIRYQAARLRANSPALEVPRAAALPDRRATYECKDGEPFAVYYPPGGVGAVLSLGGDDFALREVSNQAGRRYGDERYDLYFNDDGTVFVTLDEKRIRDRCKRE